MSRPTPSAEPPNPLALAWDKAHETARDRFGADRVLSCFTGTAGRALMDALEDAPPGADLDAICDRHLVDPTKPRPEPKPEPDYPSEPTEP